MNRILLFLLLSTASLFAGDAWPTVPYTEVRAFAWDPRATKTEELIKADLSLADGVIDGKGVLLDAQQVKRLLAAQSRRHKDRPVAACYSPHNAFVFYNGEKKAVAYLEVCFDCLGARMSPIDKECDPDFLALASICAELKLPFGEHKTVEDFKKENDWILNFNGTIPPKYK